MKSEEITEIQKDVSKGLLGWGVGCSVCCLNRSNLFKPFITSRHLTKQTTPSGGALNIYGWFTQKLLRPRKLSESRLLQNRWRSRPDLLVDKIVAANHRPDKHDIVLEHLGRIELLATHKERLALSVLCRQSRLIERPFRTTLHQC